MKVARALGWVWRHPLNCGGRMRAIARFFRWQIASVVIRAPVELPFIDATVLVTERHMTGLTGNYYAGLLQPDEMGFVLHALRPTDLFVDVGANAGSFTVLAAGAVGAQVIAFEPIPQTHMRLLRNVRANDLMSRVRAVRCGIGAENGELDFTTGFDATNRVARHAGENTVRVPVHTLDDCLDGASPTMLKIDVEGFEKWVLDGARKTLAKAELVAVILETNESGKEYGVADAELFSVLGEFGFFPHAYDSVTRQLLAYRRGQANTVFVRNPQAMTALCRSAPLFKLVNGSI